ncbi:hypothetical protein D8895_08950 [Streptococcus sp. BCA20]|uniref:Uncharacterized protein n=2 Tax=Streptococcus oralis TaxID=1303 RepID=A0A139QMX1_STROR|nr:hypothetical protein [Streptococcus oralis]KXU03711.1 hypothetical protein SORDD24_01577 [Streptococcus oralis]MBR9644411.1 hypothetical protein [Streptococcus sp. 11-4097]RSH98393.1 hypothetical protein D8893_02585 [Streptococcus oralis]RSJ35161.1 hypothetical protein D8895_08950 [Streptococcus sp. BCA20]
MKNLIKMVKETDKLGYKLSAICGVNWLIRQAFKWQYLFFVMVAGAVLIKKISATLEISPNYLGFLMVIFILAVPFSKLRFGVERFIFSFFESVVFGFIFSIAVDFPFQENESSFWLLATIFSIGIYYFMKWFQAKLFQRYLFKNILNKDYLGIRKLKDKLPPKINLFTDADEGDANQRMITINQRAVKKDYQDIVELSFLNREKRTGISYYRKAWNGSEAPLEREFVDIEEFYHPAFYVFPFGKKHDFCFWLIQFDVSKKSAFSMKGEFMFTNK